MKKAILINSLILTSLMFTATPAFADASGEVTKIQTFIQTVTQYLSLLAGTVAVAFIVIGGFRYTTSSDNPEALDGAKKTIKNSLIGLVIVIAAYVLMNLVSGAATTAFGGAH